MQDEDPDLWNHTALVALGDECNQPVATFTTISQQAKSNPSEFTPSSFPVLAGWGNAPGTSDQQIRRAGGPPHRHAAITRLTRFPSFGLLPAAAKTGGAFASRAEHRAWAAVDRQSGSPSSARQAPSAIPVERRAQRSRSPRFSVAPQTLAHKLPSAVTSSRDSFAALAASSIASPTSQLTTAFRDLSRVTTDHGEEEAPATVGP